VARYVVVRGVQTQVVFGAVFAGRNDSHSSALGYSMCLCCNFFMSAYSVSISHHKDEFDIRDTDAVFQCALHSLPIFLTTAVLNGEASSIGQVFRGEQMASVYLVVSSILAGLLNIVRVLYIRLNSSVGQNFCENRDGVHGTR
jgi:drug/metabolite transporter (DMT)-like permease